MPATLVSSGGVVTIDLNANPSDFYRVSTTENITSWNIVDDADGDGFILRVQRNSGHSVAWTGLADVWTNGVPSLAVGETIYFPMVRDGANWIGESSGSASAHPSTVLQGISFSVAGDLNVNANSGHTVEVTLTADITGNHVITNHNAGDVIAVYYTASGGSRQINFGSPTKVFPLANPGTVTLTSGQVYRATFIRQFGVTYLLDAERVT